MAVLLDLPPELILHIMTFITRRTLVDPEKHLPRASEEQELVPDLPSINALCRTNTAFHRTVDQTLYALCASVEPLGKLALLFAVTRQLESAVDKLVAAGVSLEFEFFFEDECVFEERCTLLHIAAGMGLRGMVVKLLGMYGAEMSAKVHTRLDSTQNATPLDLAARSLYFDHMEVVRILACIPTPSSWNEEVETHRQYLSCALIQSVKAGKVETSAYLVSEGADVNFFDERFSWHTPLFYAAGKNLEMVEFLLASGADPNLPDNNGFTALFHATDVNVAQALLAAGANIHARNHRSRNVLPYCMAKVELFRFFLERGVDPNEVDYRGDTPLHRACEEDYRGDTPLHHACRKKAKVFVDLLLQFGAATTVEKASSFVLTQPRTPVDIAIVRGHPEIVKILEPFVRDPTLKAKIAKFQREARWVEKLEASL
ncbi:ANK-REP-REGION domain-containing protein [Mycena venus]|uniref:ANK-REP-REGION domain-containing protein n=1 Tax=Mycena venus TaxID=2733690 RepID=A0A8H6XVS3_9AGAR|nr:ANK-REP-REGION domain-containing protein [Mycena venus]